MSKAFQFNKEDLIHTLKVAGWSIGATLVAMTISIVASIQVDAKYAFLVPIVNTLLVGLQRYVADHQK